MNLASAYPNSALPAWQLLIITLVAVGTLAVWLVGVFLAARPPRHGADEASPASELPAAREPGRPDSGAVPGTERKAA